MNRLHLVEIHDLPACPPVIRRGMTDYLLGISRLAKLHSFMAPYVQRVLDASDAERIVDLCSGSGGPIVEVRGALSEPVPLVLTDLYPHSLPEAPPDGVTSHPDAVDATAASLPGLRTICNAFHHFQPDQAKAILRSAVEARQPIAVFEVTHRDLGAFVSFFILPIVVVLVTPFLRPRLSTLLLTYVVPVLPWVIAWDGMVSHLRTYRVAELEQMTADLPGYRWEARRDVVGPGTGLTVLLGWPDDSSAGSGDTA